MLLRDREADLMALWRSSALTLGAVATLVLASRPESRQALASARNAPDPPSQEEAFSSDRRVTGKSCYSQGREEAIIRDFFRDRRNGFFLDVGCAWPIRDSNTYYLERRLGWSGIGVDALPDYAAAWQRKRPRSRFLNYLVTDHSDTVEPFYRSELLGTSCSRKDQTRGPGGRQVHREEILVPTSTLNRLLDQNGVSRIDFLSMDIEAGEPLALAGFDVARFRPELACVEAKPPVRQRVLDYFAEHGYRRIDRYLEYDQVNYYFTPGAGAR